MTFVEHGLYGGAIAYAVNPHLFWFGVAAGILPDVPPIALAVSKAGIKNVFRRIVYGGQDEFPEYIYKIYDTTHSFVTAAFLYLVLFLINPNLTILALAYGYHIICDIPFHNSRFSTRFLYPLSNLHIHGYSETKHKWVIIVQYPILVAIYLSLLRGLI